MQEMKLLSKTVIVKYVHHIPSQTDPEDNATMMSAELMSSFTSKVNANLVRLKLGQLVVDIFAWLINVKKVLKS